MLTVPDIILIAEISQYLAAVDIANGGLNYNGIDRFLPSKIENIRKSVSRRYDLSPSDSTLEYTSKYLLSICGGYYLRAAVIANSSTVGGSVVPGGGSGYMYTEISVTIGADSSTYSNTLLVNGRDLSFVILNNQILTVANGDFTFDNTSGVVTFITVQLFIGDKLTLPFNKKI